jgi:Icc-related predicted phosphoesterase
MCQLLNIEERELLKRTGGRKDNGLLMKAMNKKEQIVKDILLRARKPILYVKGNYDVTEWRSAGTLYNINLKRINAGDYNFVGYQYTSLDHIGDKKLAAIENLVDSNTILVTHAPAYGILDYTMTVQNRMGHIGSIGIKSLLQRKKPRYHLFGHAHVAEAAVGTSINGCYQSKNKFIRLEL